MTRKATSVYHPKHLLVLRPWRALTRAEKCREVVRYATRNSGLAITLNFGPDFQSYLAASTSQEPMRVIGKRMNAELARHDLNRLPIMLVLEATKEEARLHVHGVYLAGGCSKQTIGASMRRAVGVVSGRGGARQFKAKHLYGADGWWSYINADVDWTRQLLGLSSNDQLRWTSHSMTRLVRNNYEAVRLGRNPAANDT
jgi:hypothetical protein